MSNIDIGTAMRSLNVGEKIPSYTGVIIHVGQNSSGEEVTYSAGNNSGYVLEVDNPLGTQEMAYSILAGLKLRGVSYQPFNAESAILDPAAEIGDNITVNGLDSVIMATTTKHNRLMAADVSAPMEEELDHEFKYEPKSVREFKRESSYTRSRLTIAQDEISAEVTRATSIEGELSSRITLTADAITSEVTRATAAEGNLSTRITQTADAITSEVTRATAAEGTLSSRITQTSNAITSEVSRATSAEGTLSTRIDQRLDSITLSVSSSAGSSTFTLKDGSTTLDTKSLDLSVKAVNISGTLTIGQLPSDVATDSDIPTKVSELTNDSGFQNATQVTTITNNTISTTNVLAQNLQVKAANISGLLKASQIEVGSGSNLFPNYDSFEQVTNSTLYYAKASTLTAEILTISYAREGANVMSLSTGTNATNAYVFIGHSSNNYGQVRCSPGRYVFSFYARNTTGQSVLNCQVFGRKTMGSSWSDSTVYTRIAQTDVSITGGYVRGEIPFEVTSTYPFICVRFQLKTASRTIYVDCLQLEKVDNANQGAGAWHPAGTTIINGGNITAGTITADAIAAHSITVSKLSGSISRDDWEIDFDSGVLTIGTISADNITAGTINAENITVSNINGANIRAGTIGSDPLASGAVTGGSGGKIASETITTFNTESGINTNLGYGAAYGLATTNGSGVYPSFFRSGIIYVSNSFQVAGSFQFGTTFLTLKTVTISGTTIHYLGY